MNKALVKGLILSAGVIDLTVSVFFTHASWTRMKAMPEIVREPASIPAEGHGEAGGHGAPAAGAHGAAPAHESAGGHGAATAAADPHGGKLRSWVALEEMFVNVQSDDTLTHTVSFKLEIELFDESLRTFMEERQAIVKNAIIEVARLQPYDGLNSMAGKLYFKEALVGKVNQTVKYPLIRDVHLASFALR